MDYYSRIKVKAISVSLILRRWFDQMIFNESLFLVSPFQLFFRYRTRFRPTYKIAFKLVTELEWRCCPGYQGPDCRELKGSPNRQPVHPQSHQQSHQGQPRHAQSRTFVLMICVLLNTFNGMSSISFRSFYSSYCRTRTTRNRPI